MDNTSGLNLGDYGAGKDGREPELSRVLELFVLLADQLIQMEQTVAEHFPRKLLPGGETEDQKGLTPELVRQFVILEDSDPARARLKQEMERRLTGLNYQVWSVLKSMESLPRRYAKTRAPAAIEESPEIGSGGGGLFRSDGKFKKYWEKYVELCGGRDAGTLIKTLSDLHAQILVEILQARSGPAARTPGEGKS